MPPTKRLTDAQFMADAFQWPGLFLPIKRYVDGAAGGKRLECAYLMNPEPVIYHGNMWAPKPDYRKETFASFDAIVAAGWQVD